MTSMVVIHVIVFGILLSLWVEAAPTIGNRQAQLAFNLEAKSTIPHIEDVDSLLISPPAQASQSTWPNSATPERQQYPYSFSYLTADIPSTFLEPTTTITVTKEKPVTITLSADPTTVTDFITIIPSPLSSSSSYVAPSTTMRNDGKGPAKAIWEAPANLDNLASFQVSKYAGGEKNIKVVTGIPAQASARPSSDSSRVAQISKSPMPWDNSSWAMQLFYPEDSIDPGQDPQGGADFYAAPLDISDARNVSFRYSVFFPVDFDWVLAGKLPGLYGGRTGCSGGNAALDCFSTRLMWRQDGAGELYLYAPKEKQTKQLCDDPASVCDAAYGLSIGRGSFKWEVGAWTTVQQTIFLNTPGKQDGAFTLEVNGERRIDRNDVFYREDLSNGDDGNSDKQKPKKSTKTTKTRTKTTTRKPPSSSSDGGDILGPILGGLLGGLRQREDAIDIANVTATYTLQQSNPVLPAPTVSIPEPTTAIIADLDDSVTVESAKETEVKFVGMFFSTFFGGHEDKYATPRDQYVWFKDFALTVNS